MNSVQLIGNLGADPEVKYFEGGSHVAKFSLYLNERSKKNGETKERVYRVVIECWGKTAEFVGNYLRKGNRVAVIGALQENTWESDGQKHSRLIIRANRIENLTPKSADDTSCEEEDF
jgi:single-strand DNA-binding protein